MAKRIKDVMSKSKAAKMARKGKDMGKKGPGFQKIVNKTKGKYGQKSAEKIAGSVFQRMRGKGQL